MAFRRWILIVGGCAAFTPAMVQAQALRRDTAIDSAHARVAEFVVRWRAMWTRSDQQRHPLLSARPTVDATTPRSRKPKDFGFYMPIDALPGQVAIAWARCAGTTTFDDPRIAVNEIPSRTGSPLCPSGLLFDRPRGGDESRALDANLIAPVREEVRQLRAKLLLALDSAAAKVPDDIWLTNQRVRFLVDQQEWVRAASIAEPTCGIEAWWCGMLRGYVVASQGELLAADSTFMAALRLAPAESRCRFLDVGILMDAAGRDTYSRIPCAGRDSLDDRIWWLADPLHGDRANDRQSEQIRRRMMIELRAAAGENDRYQLLVAPGGDAGREMIERYGWPTDARWVISPDEIGARSERAGRGRAELATAEYLLPRVASFPPWGAISDPWHAVDSAWAIYVGDGDWAREHFLPEGGPILPLDHQALITRRDGIGKLFVATQMPQRESAATVQGRLAMSASPYHTTVVPVSVSPGGRLATSVELSTSPLVVSIEAVAKTGGWAARSRFGVPSGWRENLGGDSSLAITRPALVAANLPDGSVAITDEWLLANISPSTAVGFADLKRAIYWELYGAKPGDALDVAVTISRPGRKSGLFSRITHIGRSDESAEVTIHWRDVVASDVTVVRKAIVVDMSHLAPDAYSMTVTVMTAGRSVVSPSRTIQILPASARDR